MDLTSKQAGKQVGDGTMTDAMVTATDATDVTTGRITTAVMAGHKHFLIITTLEMHFMYVIEALVGYADGRSREPRA